MRAKWCAWCRPGSGYTQMSMVPQRAKEHLNHNADQGLVGTREIFLRAYLQPYNAPTSKSEQYFQVSGTALSESTATALCNDAMPDTRR